MYGIYSIFKPCVLTTTQRAGLMLGVLFGVPITNGESSL